jgi:endonuclease/exonuclease/phosphatase family metal-dependent hydrolase
MSIYLRIATYNIHKCRGLDLRVDPRRIVRVLREIDADVIAMQEVISAPGRGEQDQAQLIASELEFHSCFGENRWLNGAAYGNLLTYPGILPFLNLDHIYFDAGPETVSRGAPQESNCCHRLRPPATRRRF